jgi:hypothetical protein
MRQGDKRVRESQNRGEVALLRYLKEVLGNPYDGELAQLTNEMRNFLKDVRRGRIPYLRNDTWHPTTDDLNRWEAAERAAAYRDD